MYCITGWTICVAKKVTEQHSQEFLNILVYFLILLLSMLILQERKVYQLLTLIEFVLLVLLFILPFIILTLLQELKKYLQWFYVRNILLFMVHFS